MIEAQSKKPAGRQKKMELTMNYTAKFLKPQEMNTTCCRQFVDADIPVPTSFWKPHQNADRKLEKPTNPFANEIEQNHRKTSSQFHPTPRPPGTIWSQKNTRGSIILHFLSLLYVFRTFEDQKKFPKNFRPDQPHASQPVAEWPNRPPKPAKQNLWRQ